MEELLRPDGMFFTPPGQRTGKEVRGPTSEQMNNDARRLEKVDEHSVQSGLLLNSMRKKILLPSHPHQAMFDASGCLRLNTRKEPEKRTPHASTRGLRLT